MTAATALLALTACATTSPAYHEFVMQGQVLSVDGGTIVVCVGEREGAAVGQVLDVVRHVPAPSSPKATGLSFRRKEIGSVRVASVFDEHYATAEVLDGAPQVNDTVELER